MSAATWKTFDGRVIPIRAMDQNHLENAIKWLERRGIAGGLMTPEQLEEDPVAKAEWLMGDVNEFTLVKYQQLLAERERRRAEVLNTRALMAATHPGHGAEQSGAGVGGLGGAPAGSGEGGDDAVEPVGCSTER
jgi:hypothetical protein